MDTRYIFVTGGVTSSLGKGIAAASLGRLLKARGYTVAIQKFDPYLNIDPGTMNPYQPSWPPFWKNWSVSRPGMAWMGSCWTPSG